MLYYDSKNELTRKAETLFKVLKSGNINALAINKTNAFILEAEELGKSGDLKLLYLYLQACLQEYAMELTLPQEAWIRDTSAYLLEKIGD